MSAMYRSEPEPSDDEFDWDFLLDLPDDDDALSAILPSDLPLETHLALDKLFDEGFTWEEGMRLLAMREHYYEHPETRERLEADPHIGFVRWLYQRGAFTS